MINRSLLLRRVFPAGLLLVGMGFFGLRGCKPEQISVTNAAESPSARLAFRETKAQKLSRWSSRFAERKAPPAELVRDVDTTAGQLENGLRYILSPSHDAPGELSIRFLVLAGSMHETEAERGFAHFVEHLAFMGRKSRPQGHTLEEFERLGLAAGPDANASTARDHTLYKLDLPLADDRSTEEAFEFLRDVSDGLLFREEDVDSEKRVVLREFAERQKAELFNRRVEALLPQVPAVGQSPIGKIETISQATPERLRGYWKRNYVAPRLVISVVGDFEAQGMEEKIRRHFESLPRREAPLSPDQGNPLELAGLKLLFLPSRANSEVKLTIAAPWAPETMPDGPLRRRRDLGQGLVLDLLSARLSREIAEEDRAASQTDESHVSILPGIGWSEVEASAKPERVVGLLESLVSDFVVARDQGFNDLEFAEAKGRMQDSIRDRFMGRLSESNSTQAALLADSFRTGEMVESPEDELNRTRSDLATITREECETMLRSDWRDEYLRILISGSLSASMEEQAEAALARALEAPRGVSPGLAEVKPLSIESFGDPGALMKHELDEDRGILEATFSNGVLVRLKPMPSLGGMVILRAHAGHGLMSLPPEQPGLGMGSLLLAGWFPIENFDRLDFRGSIATAGLSSHYYPLESSLSWDGAADRDDLDRLLQVTCARILRPGFAKQERTAYFTRNQHAALSKVGDSRQFAHQLDRLLSGNDPRLDLYTPDVVSRDSRQVIEWLVPILEKERLCVMLAGDFEPEKALKQLAATFGAIPLRLEWSSSSPPQPLSPTAPGPYLAKPDPTFPGLSNVALAFPWAPPADARDEILQALLEKVLALRLAALLREEKGESYSTDVHRMDSADGLNRWFVLRAYAAHDRSEAVAESMRGLAEGIRRDGWTNDEFLRAARPLEFAFRRAGRSPWMNLSRMLYPERIPSPGDLDAGKLEALEPALRRLAEGILVPEKAVELRSASHE